ncbi:type VI secretion system contractile sheath large subunit [Azospirillum sp. HJ39]|uniref:type VI secretion system contractile sheath large subunit n=1 Tax=Azospirillum sp. HJ39 TaxID=3159496 RepID=UPI0035592609
MANETLDAQGMLVKTEMESGSILDRILTEGKMARDVSQTAHAKDLIGQFIAQVIDSGVSVSKDSTAVIKARIAEIDELISGQLNEILHEPDLQKLEATWRGMHYMVSRAETGPTLKLRFLNASKKELLADFEKASEFDQSSLFKAIYEAEYGTFGGQPYGMLIGDYEFGRNAQDMELLKSMSQVAAAAHAPFISAASPRLFDMDSFAELGNPRDLSKIFESSELAKWKSLRESEDSRYVTLALPHILMRLPYGPDTKPVEGVNFTEDVDGADHSKFVWGNAAWALGARITDAFSKYGWCAAIRGVEGGGLVEGLPAYSFKTDNGDIALKCPTEVAITDRREKELNDLGFISLIHCKGTDYAAFFGGQTVNKPKIYNTDSANANARLSAVLPYVMAASRFAHYLKAIMRDKVGSFQSRADIQKFLNTWIAQYVNLDDQASHPTKARLPLREARVDVFEVPGKPGAYRATVFLRPHFQLEELTTSIRLVAELPAAASGAAY